MEIANLRNAERTAIEKDILATYPMRGAMAQVDSSRAITNLHVPCDVIIDNSLPTAIRGGGRKWNADGKEEDFLAGLLGQHPGQWLHRYGFGLYHVQAP